MICIDTYQNLKVRKCTLSNLNNNKLRKKHVNAVSPIPISATLGSQTRLTFQGSYHRYNTSVVYIRCPRNMNSKPLAIRQSTQAHYITPFWSLTCVFQFLREMVYHNMPYVKNILTTQDFRSLSLTCSTKQMVSFLL